MPKSKEWYQGYSGFIINTWNPYSITELEWGSWDRGYKEAERQARALLKPLTYWRIDNFLYDLPHNISHLEIP